MLVYLNSVLVYLNGMVPTFIGCTTLMGGYYLNGVLAYLNGIIPIIMGYLL